MRKWDYSWSAAASCCYCRSPLPHLHWNGGIYQLLHAGCTMHSMSPLLCCTWSYGSWSLLSDNQTVPGNTPGHLTPPNTQSLKSRNAISMEWPRKTSSGESLTNGHRWTKLSNWVIILYAFSVFSMTTTCYLFLEDLLIFYAISSISTGQKEVIAGLPDIVAVEAV